MNRWGNMDFGMTSHYTFLPKTMNSIPFCGSVAGQTPNQPFRYFSATPSGGGKTGPRMDTDRGTTTLGFKFQGGIILAVDSRTTRGDYIRSEATKKVFEINPYLMGTMAGCAADCVYWERVLAKECRLYELRTGNRISVVGAIKMITQIARENDDMGLRMGMIIAGYDSEGLGLYYVDHEGRHSTGNVFSVGSGSVYTYGILDTGYRWDLKDEDALDLGQRAVFYATNCDAYSGGVIRLYQVTPSGWKNISNTNCKDLHAKYVNM